LFFYFTLCLFIDTFREMSCLYDIWMLFRGVANYVRPEALFGAEGSGYDHIVKKVLTLFVPTKQIPKDMLMGLKL
jgi:hypothetical protein